MDKMEEILWNIKNNKMINKNEDEDENEKEKENTKNEYF